VDDNDSLRAASLALSGFFLGEDTLETTLQRVVELTHEAVPAARLVGITLLDEQRRPVTGVFTKGEAVEIDQAQYRLGDGPCVHAFHHDEIVRIADTSTDPRWREFMATAREHGIRSTLSIPLACRGDRLGAMNLYARSPSAFGPDEERTAIVFAGLAAAPLANARLYWSTVNLSVNLRQALESRAVIDEAKGVLMAERQIDPDDAFTLLTDLSQRRNEKLRVLAERIVADRSAKAVFDDDSSNP
jgi:GAF domain-containing protein